MSADREDGTADAAYGADADDAMRLDAVAQIATLRDALARSVGRIPAADVGMLHSALGGDSQYLSDPVTLLLDLYHSPTARGPLVTLTMIANEYGT